MSPDQLQSAAHELRERASSRNGDAAGMRCLELAKALETLAAERLPYAWEVKQDGRTFLISAAEFTQNSYDRGSFKPLYDN